MILYSEEKIGNQSIFVKTILDNNANELSKRTVSIPLYKIEKDNFTYFILYDDNMNVIEDFYEYLNFTLRESPLTTRSKAAFSLRLLYCFLSLSKYNIKKINTNILSELIFFLRGINSNPQKYSIKTTRSANTVNSHLSVYRKYFVSNKIKCEPLFKSHISQSSNITDGDFTSIIERKKYDSNVKTSSVEKNSVPKYISPDEFKKIYKLTVDKNDITAQLVIQLMYCYGLRLGEVLGLTMEDIKEGYENNELIPFLLLRNRLSDKKFQFAKNLPHVISKNQYNSTDYIRSKSKIIITYEVYEKLIEYIEKIHTFAMENYKDNYDLGEADIVSTRNKPDYNHYVFLNRYGRVLSDQTWNKILKKYFYELEIPIDVETKENNLSHRFRHGFAMFHARYSEKPADILSLQKLMRHKSISSTMVYYNPTDKEQLNIKKEFQEELYDMMPELKEGLYDKL